MLTIKAKNYRGLQDIHWEIPQGLSVLIGPNGAGKSTLLGLIEFLSNIVFHQKGPDDALLLSGGASTLRYKSATENHVSFELKLNDLLWELRLLPQNGGLARFPYEKLTNGAALVYERIAGNNSGKWKGQELTIDGVSALDRLSGLHPKRDFEGEPILSTLITYNAFRDYDLSAVREGSKDLNFDALLTHGTNVFSLLRNWGNTIEGRERRDFVVKNLREYFPFFRDMEFEVAGNVVAGTFRHTKYPRKEDKFQMGAAPNGFLTAMMHLCAVAGADPRAIIAIDDFESCLHPEAITKLLTAIEEDAKARNISVVIATQSPQVLNYFDEKPEQVYVVDDRLRPSPTPLLKLRTRDWLSYFKLGDKFQEGDFAGLSPEEPKQESEISPEPQ
jgi:predicted ATPase